MRMMMRLQPAQVNPVTKVVGTSAIWDRRLLMHAGYKWFDMIAVGASGGWGGRSYRSSANYSYGGGPGGGGCIRIRGLLTDLTADATIITAGVQGGNGADVGTGSTGGTGVTGGDSSFYAWKGLGGKGGKGGKVTNSGGLGDTYEISDGGAGGDNSLGYGAPGVGSVGDSSLVAPNHTAATGGTYAVSGDDGGGGGGGGESGKADSETSGVYNGASGKTGNATAFTGIAGAVTSNKGGAGGGANIAPVTGGAAEYYGGAGAGSNPAGCVYVKAWLINPSTP